MWYSKYCVLFTRAFFIISLLASLTALLPAPAVAQSKDAAQAVELDRKLIGEAKLASEIMANLTHLSDMIGPRLTGSAALKRANDWTAEKMKSYGLSNVHLEAWELPVGWERGSAFARIIEPGNGRTLSLAAMGWTPGTKGKIEGDVVVLAAKTTKELEAFKGKLKNAIVLRGPPATVRPITDLSSPVGRPGPAIAAAAAGFDTRRPSSFADFMAFRREMSDFLRKEGAAAVFHDAAKPHGLLSVSGGWTGRDRASAPDTLPALTVAHEHYALLHRLASRSAPARTRVEIEVTNEFIPGPIPVYNTVGEIPGSEKPNEFVIVGAHLDSWDLGQGTTDNGTGTCVVLEAARLISRCGVRPRRSIRFVLFSGEEQGLHGSRAYVQQHKDELPRTSVCLVHDIGTGKVNGIGVGRREPLKPILERELTSLKVLGVTDISTRSMGGSDHAAFEQAGVPGFIFFQDPAEYRLTHHSQSDTLDKAREADLIQGAQVMAVIAMRIANMDGLLPRDKK